MTYHLAMQVTVTRRAEKYYRVENNIVRTLIVEEVNKHDYKAIERLLGR
jgi:hypothetical protein